MITVLKEYIKIRIHLKQLIVLTVLMTFLILSLEHSKLDWIFTLVFLFASFIVFRIFDDAFSVIEDRNKHPERTYLLPKNFTAFKRVTLISIALYLVGIGLVFFSVFYIILSLFLVSVGLYLLLRKQPLLLALTPLLKYPVLLYCISTLTQNSSEFEVFLASFFLMLGYDSFDAVKKKPNHIWKPMLFLFCCSLLLFKPWEGFRYSLYIIVPLLIIYLFRKNSYIHYFSIMVFPLLFFHINNIII